MPLSSDDERGARLRYCVCWPESPPMGSTACQRPALRAVRCAPHDEGGSRRRGSLSTPRHWVLPRHYTGGPGCPRARFPRRRGPREDPARRDAPTIVGPARPGATCVNPNVMHNTVGRDALWTGHELFTRLNGPRRDAPGQSRGRKSLRTGPLRDVVAGDMGNQLLIRGSRVRSPPGPPRRRPGLRQKNLLCRGCGTRCRTSGPAAVGGIECSAHRRSREVRARFPVPAYD